MENSTKGSKLMHRQETLLESMEIRWKSREAAHELNGHCGRKGILVEVVKQFWWLELNVTIKTVRK